ncbi:MAG: radical SAM family heme chaperone HemW [Opitutaceae bacterium]|nr:radical SAM family heme chaperone HemW [Opitutaceae bacterium]
MSIPQDNSRDNPPGGGLSRGAGLYVHVPFCATRCDFCAFYQVAPTVARTRLFLDAVEREAGLAARDAPRFATAFWGGGTPGALSAANLARLGALVKKNAGGGLSEWTVELTPASASEARLEALREAGVTRVSIGVQSLRGELLEKLGRRHTPRQSVEAFGRARKLGFAVNIDLMFALPGQSRDEWLGDLGEALRLEPDHVSTYCLTLEEDTALWLRLGGGRTDPEREADLYLATWDFLEERGWRQYEISNFARPGFECAHNLNTWAMGEWIGLGPSAASQHGRVRGSNAADLDAWAAAVDRGERLTGGRTALDDATLAEDALIFGLRANAGVDLAGTQRRFPGGDWERLRAAADALCGNGLAEQAAGRLRLTRRGRLLADAAGAEFLK